MTASNARICIIAPEFVGPFPNGGVGTACFWEASTLATAGYDVTVLYTGPTDRETPEHWEQTYAAGPFTYVDLWRWAAGATLEAVDHGQHPCAEARTSELVFRFLRDTSFDLLLFQEFLGHGARTLQARRSGEALSTVPAAVTLHSCRQWIYEGMRRLPSSRDDMYVDFLERESARLADHVIAPSQHMADWAAAHWHLATPVDVIPYCYDQKLQRPALPVEHAGPFKHLVFFGRLETRKGLHNFCRALEAHANARGAIDTITFLGKTSTVEGRPSEEFIRTTLGGLPGIDVRILSHLGSLEALDWLERQAHTIVVAPSLVDNLPYAVIELFARRFPFISNRIGGIPEIVGARNQHILAEPTAEGLATVLTRVHQANALAIDYRDGYAIDEANAAHLDYVGAMLRDFSMPQRVPVTTCSVVVVDGSDETLPAVRDRFVAADSGASRAEFLTWHDWRAAGDSRPAVFVSVDVVPRDGLIRRLLSALEDARVTAATCYYESETASGPVETAPLGASLESGWIGNVFGGPCFAARDIAFDVLRHANPASFRFWPAYAAMVCTGLDVALVPQALFSIAGASAPDTLDAVEAVIDQYRSQLPRHLDLGWVLKYASTNERSRAGATGPHAATDSPLAGRALYNHLLAIPDTQLQAFSGLTWAPVEDPFVGDMRRLRQRLGVLAARWQATDPRVFVYGAGEHARLILALEPELGRFIAGFIDRRPMSEFLGKPCIRPEELTPAIADVVLYSSREFEQDMYARLASVNVQHLLLYSPSPESERDTTSTRVRRRLGHTDAAIDGLHSLYKPPSWVRGGCSHGDVEFLVELVTGINPRLVLELGVASGTSSAALLYALDQLPSDEAGRLLHSCDVRGTCYFDENRATGSAVDDMYPQRRTSWLLDTNSDARRVRDVLASGSVDFAFIDANHCHPWPLIDLLHISTLLRPEAWIALHDIELPRLHPQFQVHGPQWLFEAWPFNKIHGVDGSANIGAVQLPARLTDMVPMALALLARSWEHTPTSWDVDLSEMFDEVSRALASHLAKPTEAALPR